MRNRKLVYALFALAAGAGCTFNGKPLFGSRFSSLTGGGGGGAWCKELREESSAYGLERALDPEADFGQAVPAIMQAMCFPRDDARGKRDALEAARRTWMQRLALDERAWAAELVPWANRPYAERMAVLRHGVEPAESVAWSAAGPIEQYALVGESHYRADALPLTEAGRLAFIESCMSGGPVVKPVEWAICQPDIDALDAGKLAAELRGETARPIEDRLAVRLSLFGVQRHLPEHAAAVGQLVAKDPAYAKLFEIARTARKDWDAAAASRADLLAAVRAMDDARATGSRKALEGCSARTWPLFAAAVAGIPAKRFEDLRGDRSLGHTFLHEAIGAVLQDPDAYLAANALYACEGEADYLLQHLGRGLAYWSGFRGPRTAALTAIRLANLTPDRRDTRIEIPRFDLDLAIERKQPDMGKGNATGVIATVTDRGDTVRVTFPSSSEMIDDCVSRRRTDRISRIDNGHVYYESVCTQWKRVRIDTTLKPVDVPKRYAAGLQAKRYVSIQGGVPEAVWAKSSSPTPLAAFGVLLK